MILNFKPFAVGQCQHRKLLGKGFVERKLGLLAAVHVLDLRLVFGDLIVAQHKLILRADLVGVLHLGTQPPAHNVGLGGKAALPYLFEQ